MAKRTVSKQRKGKPPPTCKAMLLCDQPIVDANTGKLSLIGIFEQFIMPQFPGVTSPFTAFMQFTDGIGDYSITIEVHDLRENKVIARTPGGTVKFLERTTKANMIVYAAPLPIPHSGAYDFVVFADGDLVEHQQFLAVTRSEQQNASDPAGEPDSQ